MNRSAKASTTVVSVVLSLMVIGLLFMAGPAKAITVTVGAPSDTTPTKGDTVTIDLDVNIEALTSTPATERVPINNISVYVTGPGGPYECFFDSAGTLIDTGVDFCDSLSLSGTADTPVYADNQEAEGYTTGGSEELVQFGYGYGYGFVDDGGTELQYTLSWDTSDASTASSYVFNARVYAAIGADAGIFTSATTRSVRVGTSSSGGGGSRSSDEPPTNLPIGQSFNGTLTLGGGGQSFWTADGFHFVKLLDIYNGGALFEIKSTPQQAFLYPGETVQVDVNSDGDSDVALSLDSVESNKAVIRIEPGTGTPSALRPAPVKNGAAPATETAETPAETEEQEEQAPPAATGAATGAQQQPAPAAAAGPSMAGVIFVIIIVVLLGVGAYLIFRKKE